MNRFEVGAARLLHAIIDDKDIAALVDESNPDFPFAADGELLTTATALQSQLRRSRARLEVQDALLDVANELADNDADGDRTLRAIVDRTLTYFKCDLAYLTMNDFDRLETYVAYTAGEAKVPTRIPFGTGIGGRVASTAQPFSTRDYLADSRIVHVPHVDATIVQTRQRAVMAAPLVYGGHVIGVLHASNKTPGEFTPDEVDTLSAFARFAAVASERSRLMAELRSANSSLERQTVIVERSISAHEKTMDVILRGGGLQDVVDGAFAFLNGDLVILDLDGKVVASNPGVHGDTLRQMTRILIATAHDNTTGDSAQQIQSVTLQAGEEVLGSLMWRPPRDAVVNESDVRLFERTAVIASLLLLFQKHLADAEAQVRGELMADLLSATGTSLDAVQERARRVGFQLNESMVVIAIDAPHAGRRRLLSTLREAVVRVNGLSGIYEGSAVAVLSTRDSSKAAADLLRTLTPQMGTSVTLGASSVIGDPTGLHRGFAEATACLLALQRLGRFGQSASVSEMGYVGLLIGGGTSAADFVERTLGPIRAHDEQRRSGLTETLDVYFSCGQSLATSAEHLHVHTNTVTQRLARCTQLLQVDVHEPAAALDIQLALRLIKIGVVS